MNYVSDSAGITIPSDLSCGHYFGTLDHESLSLILSAIAIEKKIRISTQIDAYLFTLTPSVSPSY